MKMAVIAHEPAHEGEKEFSKRGVDIEEVGSLKVVRSELEEVFSLVKSVPDRSMSFPVVRLSTEGTRGGYLSKVDFVEDDFIGMIDAPKPRDKCNGRYDEESKFVIPFRRDCRLGRGL